MVKELRKLIQLLLEDDVEAHYIYIKHLEAHIEEAQRISFVKMVRTIRTMHMILKYIC